MDPGLQCPARVRHGTTPVLKAQGIDTFDAVQANVEFENGAGICFEVSWILPRQFEAVVNQGLRLVGTKGLWEVDTQNRGVAVLPRERPGCAPGTTVSCASDTTNEADRSSRATGPKASRTLRLNVNFLLEGGNLEELAGKYPDGTDGLEVTKIAVATHQSIDTGKPVDLAGAMIDPRRLSRCPTAVHLSSAT